MKRRKFDFDAQKGGQVDVANFLVAEAAAAAAVAQSELIGAVVLDAKLKSNS